MGIDIDFNLDDHIPDTEPLDVSQYPFEIRDCQTTKNGSLMANVTLLGGNKQKTGLDPAGLERTIFLSTTTDRVSQYPRLVQKIKDALKTFFDAANLRAGADPSDFAGKKMIGYVAHRNRKDESGTVTSVEEDWYKFKPYVE